MSPLKELGYVQATLFCHINKQGGTESMPSACNHLLITPHSLTSFAHDAYHLLLPFNMNHLIGRSMDLQRKGHPFF